MSEGWSSGQRPERESSLTIRDVVGVATTRSGELRQPPGGYEYLGSPYSHPRAAVRELRYRQAKVALERLQSTGLKIYSPIVHWHPVSLELGLTGGWDFWAPIDGVMLAASAALRVLMSDGWEDSKGLYAERMMAAGLGKPVIYEAP